MEALIILLGELAITCFVVGICILKMPEQTWQSITTYSWWALYVYKWKEGNLSGMFPDNPVLREQWKEYRIRTLLTMFMKYSAMLWIVLNLLFIAGLMYIKYVRV